MDISLEHLHRLAISYLFYIDSDDILRFLLNTIPPHLVQDDHLVYHDAWSEFLKELKSMYKDWIRTSYPHVDRNSDAYKQIKETLQKKIATACEQYHSAPLLIDNI